jgi:hypothetical protein
VVSRLASFKLFCGGDGDRSVKPVKTTPELPSILTSEGMGAEYEKKLFTIFNIVILVDSIGSCKYDRSLFYFQSWTNESQERLNWKMPAKNGHFYLLEIKMCSYELFSESRARRTSAIFSTLKSGCPSGFPISVSWFV